MSDDDISTEATLAVADPPDPQAQPGPQQDGPARPGEIFGEYLIEGVLGRGGMGVVYRVRHCTLDRPAALKILNLSREGRGVDDPRFLREARNSARLEHHNIVAVYNAGMIDELLFIEMQLVDGQPLSRLVADGRPLDPRQATRYVEQVAHALHHAHSRGIVHRDIKPDNLLVTPDSVVKVTDFGLAKQPTIDTALTAPGSLLGTPSYMAPEQWGGEPADARTDLYALGGTYFHLVTGQPPFKGKLPELMNQHVSSPVPPAHELNPDVPPSVSALIARMMAKRVEDRPQSAAELVASLRRLQLELWEQKESPEIRQQEAAEVEVGPAPLRPAVEPRPALCTVGWPLLALLWAVVTALVVVLDHTPVWRQLELRSVDRRMVGRDPTSGTDAVALVLIDNRTAAKLLLPLHRDVLAEVVESLSMAGARAVALDLLIADPLSNSEDLELALVSMERPGVIHALDLIPGPTGGPQVPSRFAVPVEPGSLLRGDRAALPIPPLVARAHHLGNIELVVDPDGLIRRVPLLMRHGDHAFPALSLVAACLALQAPIDRIRWSPGQPLFIPTRPELAVPVDEHACMKISVRGSMASRRPHSFLDVLQLTRGGKAGRAKLARRFDGRVVLVGMAVSGQHDIQPLPGLAAPPLVLAHAMAVETLLGRDFVRPARWPHLLLAVGLLALVALGVGARLPWYVVLVVVPGGIAAHWLVASHVIAHHGLALPVIAPGVALVVAGLTGWGIRFRFEQRQRRVLAEALGRYLPRRVSARILSEPGALRLGGQRKELSLVVARLQGFGALSEQLEPEEVGELLAGFFAIVSDVATRHDGTLDRFDGDGVRLFFGDPVPCSDHADRALRCALEIRRDVLAAVARWASGGRPRPPVGIGVHTGYVTVGNIGAVQRMEYTVVGRNVELAEQLAAAAPPGMILASSRTRGIAAELFVFELRESSVPTEVFELCAEK